MVCHLYNRYNICNIRTPLSNQLSRANLTNFSGDKNNYLEKKILEAFALGR